MYERLTERGYSIDDFNSVLIRVSHFLVFAHVVEKTPEIIPYWRGETYRTLLWTPIPRVVYPNKPTKSLGQDFGHRYDILQPDDFSTALNLPQLVEMYVNFGSFGVIIGMYLIGIIYRIIYEIFKYQNAGDGGFLIGVYTLTALSLIESDFSLVFGNIVWHVILLLVISQLFKK
jgi:hypothetical protein